jgi:hypothetical protein
VSLARHTHCRNLALDTIEKRLESGPVRPSNWPDARTKVTLADSNVRLPSAGSCGLLRPCLSLTAPLPAQASLCVGTFQSDPETLSSKIFPVLNV